MIPDLPTFSTFYANYTLFRYRIKKEEFQKCTLSERKSYERGSKIPKKKSVTRAKNKITLKSNKKNIIVQSETKKNITKYISNKGGGKTAK